MEWVFSLVPNKKPRLENPVLVEGLPGIGNVGKVAVDYMIEKLQAQKLYTIFSHHIPHTVFINEDNLVELPKMEIYYKKFRKRQHMLFLTGDTQPIDEPSCFSFCERLIHVASEHHCNKIITLGGVGLRELPKKPKLYISGTSKEVVKRYKTPKMESNLYGRVGPIVGVSGVLVALAKMKRKDAITLLGETLANPMYIGVRAAKEMLDFFNDNFNLRLNLKYLDGEIKEMENELRTVEELEMVQSMDQKSGKKGRVSYIG